MIRTRRLASMGGAALAVCFVTATALADEPGWGAPPPPPPTSPLLPAAPTASSSAATWGIPPAIPPSPLLPSPPPAPPAPPSPPSPPAFAPPAKIDPGAPAAAARSGKGAWRSFRAGSDLVGSVPMAAILDGSWSIATQINTTIVGRTWTTPRPYGTLGNLTRRITYGFSWSLMLGVESMLAIATHGGTIDWIGGAQYRTDWMMPLDLPACRYVGADGGCGIGVGNMAWISIQPRHSKWWFEAGGGWFEQRVLFDPIRTLGESTWVLTPLTVLRELATDPEGAIALRFLVGPGIYGGMAASHMHPSIRGQDVYSNFRASELYPLAGGVGPGGRAELAVIILRHLTLEGDLTVAPFLLGDSSSEISRAVEPLNYPRSGFPTWRKLDFGVGYQDYKVVPFKTVVEFFGAELSSRPLDRLGYRGAMIRFDVPIRVPGD